MYHFNITWIVVIHHCSAHNNCNWLTLNTIIDIKCISRKISPVIIVGVIHSLVMVVFFNSLLLLLHLQVVIINNHKTRVHVRISMFRMAVAQSSQITTSIDDLTGLSYAVFNSLSRNLTFWETWHDGNEACCVWLLLSLHNGGKVYYCYCGDCREYGTVGWVVIVVIAVIAEVVSVGVVILAQIALFWCCRNICTNCMTASISVSII